jgi:lipopolysaccharide transport system permease protein
MQTFSISPKEMVFCLWRNRGLIAALVKRDVVGRYRGSAMGILWSFLNPVFMLFVYTFVFSVVLKARWSSGSDSRVEFSLVLFSGLIVFNFFSECLNKAPGLIVSNSSYVKKVVFPLEILPVVSAGAAMFHALISLEVWLLAYTALFGLPLKTVFLMPFVFVPLLLLVLGVTWFFSSLGVYLRDVSQFVGVLVTVLMFLSPIFYPANALPEEYRILLLLNPITVAVELSRDVLYWGRAPDAASLFGYFSFSAVSAWLGFAWFQKTRKGFADVL